MSKFSGANIQLEALKTQLMMAQQQLGDKDEAKQQLEELREKMKESEDTIYRLTEENLNYQSKNQELGEDLEELQKEIGELRAKNEK